MKKTLLLCGLLLVLAVSVASAGGRINISWGDYCWGDTGSTDLLTWSCDSDSYTGIRMTCSFSVDAAHSDFIGAAVYLQGWTEGTSLPDWWQMSNQNATDCRYGMVSTHADYSVLPQYEAGGTCKPAFGDRVPAGGIGLYSWDSNWMSVDAVWATQDANALEAGQEYFLCQLRIGAGNTVDGCAGCSAEAVWRLVAINVGYTSAMELLDVSDGNEYLFWQGRLPTPVRNTTWGQIKSLYR